MSGAGASAMRPYDEVESVMVGASRWLARRWLAPRGTVGAPHSRADRVDDIGRRLADDSVRDMRCCSRPMHPLHAVRSQRPQSHDVLGSGA